MEFLKKKSAENILGVLKTYITKMRDRQIKSFWRSELIEDKSRIIICGKSFMLRRVLSLSSQPYILINRNENNSRCCIYNLVELGLPTKYWLETIYITICFRNLILSCYCLDTVLAEIWFGKWQSVSYL